MLKPIESLNGYATYRGLPAEIYERDKAALLTILLNPLTPKDGDPHWLSAEKATEVVFSHGGLVTRVVGTAEVATVQAWGVGEHRWIDNKVFPRDQDGRAAAVRQARSLSGPVPSQADLRKKWATLDSGDQDVIDKRLATRQSLAEFWYDQQAVDWGDNEPWQFMSRVAETALCHNNVPSHAYEEREREKIQTALSNLQIVWGELEPSPGIVIDTSPRYLVSVSFDKAEIGLEKGSRDRGAEIERVWMDGDTLAKTARKFGIDEASAASPGGAEHVWWMTSSPRQDATHQTNFHLHVHEITDSTAMPREPLAADYQRLADLMDVEFDEPMDLPENRKPTFGYYINLDERGNFEADVRDQSGASVFEIKAGASLEEDESNIFDDGFMKHKNDLQGLQSYLRDLAVIPPDARVVTMQDFEQELERRASPTSSLG